MKLATDMRTEFKNGKLNFDTDRFFKFVVEVDDVSVFAEKVFALSLCQLATGGVYSFHGVMRSPLVNHYEQVFKPWRLTPSEGHVLNFRVSGDFPGIYPTIFKV